MQDEDASFELLNDLKKQPMTLQVLQVISHVQIHRSLLIIMWPMVA